ncbi:MAG: DUF3422 domain-containing protein [Hyphomicrobiales bacterium]
MSNIISTHPERARVLDEVHARPFEPITSPRTVRHVSLLSGLEGATALREAICQYARKAGVAPPADGARYCVLDGFGGRLRWEQHSEFSSLTWDAPPRNSHDGLALVIEQAKQPLGQIISMTRIDVLESSSDVDFEKIYDKRSLCVSEVHQGLALIATDFRQSADGATGMSILNQGASDIAVGGLVQRLLEIETYRTLALLGLPLAQRTAPIVGDIENSLANITSNLKDNLQGVSEQLLDDITRLSADLEANAAACLFRFGASKAYHEIVRLRLDAIQEISYQHHPTLDAFLIRRMQPAMQTIRALEERQANLSRKLSRAANLLRTRVDVGLERQNRDLLASMNHRAKQQFRLQQTVEGLSIAAISYYVVGLIAYLLKGIDAPLQALFGTPYIGNILTAVSVPFVVAGMWLVVRRIRQSHAEDVSE